VRHGQWPEDFMLAEAVERFFGDALESCPQEDETDIAVFGFGARIGGERSCEGGGKKLVSRFDSHEQLFVRGQSGGVREQHAQGDCIPPGIFSGELCNDSHNGQVEVEESAFIEHHGHAGCGDDFGHGSEIKNGGGGCCGRIGFVGETAEGLESDEVPLVRDGDGSRGKDAIRNGLLD